MRFLLCETGGPQRGSLPQELLSVASRDDCARGGDTSSSRSLLSPTGTRRPGPESGGSEQNYRATIRMTPTRQPELFDLSDVGPGGVRTEDWVLMETDTKEEEEELDERRTWIDDNYDVRALIVPPGRRPHWWNIRQGSPPWEPTPGQGGILMLAARRQCRKLWTLRSCCPRRGRAILGSTVDSCSASVRGWLCGRISQFLREGGTPDPEVDSCFSPCNMAEEEVAALVVNGSGMHSTGLLVSMHLGCVPDDCRQVGVHTVRSVLYRCFDFHKELWTIFQ